MLEDNPELKTLSFTLIKETPEPEETVKVLEENSELKTLSLSLTKENPEPGETEILGTIIGEDTTKLKEIPKRRKMVEAVAKEAVEEVTDAVEAAILNTAKEREVIMKTREAVEAVVEATNLAINPNAGTQVTKEQKKAKGLIKFTYSTESDADIKATELNVNIKTKEMGAVINAKERNAIINTRELEIVVKAGEAIAIDTITLNTPNKPGEAMAGESGETPEAEETREDIMKTREAVEAMVEAVKLAANPKTRTQVEEKQMKATDLAFTLIVKEMLEAKKKASDLIITINAQDTQVVEEQQKALNLIAIATSNSTSNSLIPGLMGIETDAHAYPVLSQNFVLTRDKMTAKHGRCPLPRKFAPRRPVSTGPP